MRAKAEFILNGRQFAGTTVQYRCPQVSSFVPHIRRHEALR
jgi:hypothetical protein